MMEKMKWVSGEQQQKPMKDPMTRDGRLRHGDQGIIRTTNDQNQSCFEKDLTMYGGLSWPQRNYRCSFCKKEFKSAQALGGHMNVHRRDRARLRQLSPPLIINPNPSFSHLSPSSSAPPAPTPHHQHQHEFLLLPNMPSSSSATNSYYSPYTKSTNTVVCRSGDHGRENKNKAGAAVLEFMNKVEDARVSDNRNDFVRLNLKLGLFDQDNNSNHQDLDLDLDLDLELRLGSS